MTLKVDDRVEADLVMKDLELFNIYRTKDKVLVLIQQVKKEPISFMLQGISKPEKKKAKKKKKKIKKAIKNNERNRTVSSDTNKTARSPDTNKTGSSKK